MVPRLPLAVFLSLILLAGFVSVLRAQSAEEAVLSVGRWADTLSIDERVPGQIDLYAGENEKREFEEDYAVMLSDGVRRRIFSDITRQFEMLLKGERSPFITVTVLDPGFISGEESGSLSKTVTKFEKSFIRTEVLAFFDIQDMSPEAALRIYVDPDFRKSVSSRIKEIRKDGDETCLDMAGVKILLSPIKYCSRIDELHSPDLSIQHSQAVSSDPDGDYQTVYFKESMKAFVAVPGGLALYYINYSRTIGMGGLKKKIARKKIKESQQTAIDNLAVRFDSYVPGDDTEDDAGREGDATSGSE